MPKGKRFARQNIIGIVYDFDGTLSPNNMQEDTIFRAYHIDKDVLWGQSDKLIRMGYERTLAYLKLLIHDEAFKKRPLTRECLRKLARHIQYYPGVLSFFGRIEKFLKVVPEVREWGITVEHYIISSGMIEILEGSRIFKYFKKVYACEYAYDPGGPVFPKLVINDTNKTQFLFRINKGKLDIREDINSHMPEKQRRIPFRNLIYIGDSQTDIPSMTVVQRYGGHAVAVFNPSDSVSGRIKAMVKEGRVDHFAPADYRENKLLMKILRRTLKKIIHTIAYYGSAEMSLRWVKAHGKPFPADKKTGRRLAKTGARKK